MRRFVIPTAVLIVATLAAIFLVVRAGDKPAKNARLINALIMRENTVPKTGVVKVEAIRIIDPRKLEHLESFFPNYRQRPTSYTAGGWMAGYRVYFDFEGGESVRVTVSENENAAYWSTGHGDFDTKGDFNAFVESPN